MRDHYSMIHYLYELFYRKVYGNDKYIFKPTFKAENHISLFLNLLNSRYKLETIGINFLTTYFVFQFDYWTKLEIKTFSERIHLQFIIGGKAFDRWLTRNVIFDWTIYQSAFLKTYNISTSEIKDFFKEENFSILNKAEELEKSRFYNTDRGFLNCITNTSLFYHRSPLCATCNNKIDCKKLLKENYLQIFVARNYQ